MNPTHEADTADSAEITQADIFSALSTEKLLPQRCPRHNVENNTVLFRRGRVSKAVFGCDCVWNVAGMSWEHHD